MTDINNDEDLKSRSQNNNKEASASFPKTAADAAFKEEQKEQKPANTGGTQSVLTRVLAGEGAAPSSDSTPGQQTLPINPARSPLSPQQETRTAAPTPPQSETPTSVSSSPKMATTDPVGPPKSPQNPTSVDTASEKSKALGAPLEDPVEPPKVSAASKTEVQQETKGERCEPQAEPPVKPQSVPPSKAGEGEAKDTSAQGGIRSGPPTEPSAAAKTESSGIEGSKPETTPGAPLRDPVEPTKVSAASKTEVQQETKGEHREPQAEPPLKPQSVPPSKAGEGEVTDTSVQGGVRSCAPASPNDSVESKSNEKGPRRSLPKKVKRIETLKFRVTPYERDEIIDNIPEGIDFSDWARSLLAGKNPKAKSEKAFRAKLIGELGRIGNNINQIARKINTEGAPRDAEQSLEIISNLHAIYLELQKIGGLSDAA